MVRVRKKKVNAESDKREEAADGTRDIQVISFFKGVVLVSQTVRLSVRAWQVDRRRSSCMGWVHSWDNIVCQRGGDLGGQGRGLSETPVAIIMPQSLSICPPLLLISVFAQCGGSSSRRFRSPMVEQAGAGGVRR